MADHDVKFEVPVRKLEKADLQFWVKRDKKPFGRLYVSEGGLKWVHGYKKKKQSGISISWSDFSDYAQSKRKRQ